MTNEDFNKLVEKRLELIKNTLVKKSEEYSFNNDRLYNFARAAEIARCSKVDALVGMFNKHIVSVYDLAEGRLQNTDYMVNEKIGDAINYLILLEAVLKEESNSSD